MQLSQIRWEEELCLTSDVDATQRDQVPGGGQAVREVGLMPE